MDQKVRDYIERGKKAAKKNETLGEHEKLFTKRDMLISLGLSTQGKEVYSAEPNPEAKDRVWDEEKKMWRYHEIIVPELTDDEYEAVLEAHKALQEDKEEWTPRTRFENKRTASPAETILDVIGIIALIIGIGYFIIGIYGTIKAKTLIGLFWGLRGAAPFILTWAVLNIISNISANIRGIKDKLEERTK